MGILDIIDNLSNDQLSVFDNWVIWMNLAGAGAGYWFNHKASKIGLISMRRSHFLISGLAAFYTASYLFLLLADPRFAQLSSFMRGVSLVAWPLVWIWPAILSIRTWKKFNELLAIEDMQQLEFMMLEFMMSIKDDEDDE